MGISAGQALASSIGVLAWLPGIVVDYYRVSCPETTPDADLLAVRPLGVVLVRWGPFVRGRCCTC